MTYVDEETEPLHQIRLWSSQNTNNVTIFNFNASEIRVVTIEDNPWFVASDVIRTLDMDTNQTANYIRWLDATEKRKVHRFTLNLFKGRGTANYNCISESGLYKLVMRSDKPQAKPFQDWVTKVVLPAIRKDGGYIITKKAEVVITKEEQSAVVALPKTPIHGSIQPSGAMG